VVFSRAGDLRHDHCGIVAGNPPRLQLFSTSRREVFLMPEHAPQNDSPQVDEAVWKAWVEKNEAKDQIRLARRQKILGFAVILGVIMAIRWMSGM
jgi:hypothetical protein